MLVGAASAIAHDVHPTPISETTSGPLIHFHAIAAALDSEFLRETSPLISWSLLLGAGCLAWAVVAFVRQSMLALSLLVVLNAGYLGATVYFYDTRNLFILTLPVLGAFDLVRLWWTVNLAIGLAVLYRRRTAPVATALIAVYAVIALVYAAATTAF